MIIKLFNLSYITLLRRHTKFVMEGMKMDTESIPVNIAGYNLSIKLIEIVK